MPAPIRYSDRIVFVGDSITAASWYSATGGLIDQLGTLGTSLTVVNSGVGGDKAANIAGAVTSRIVNNRPNVLVLQVGVNDATAATPIGAFRASYDSILSQTQAWSPGVSIICVSILCNGELWTSVNGPRFAGNATDTYIDILNGQIRASATLAGATYSDVRTPAAVYTSTVNLPEPGSTPAFVTSDNIHPVTAGQVVMGTATFGCFSFPGVPARRNNEPLQTLSIRGAA